MNMRLITPMTLSGFALVLLAGCGASGDSPSSSELMTANESSRNTNSENATWAYGVSLHDGSLSEDKTDFSDFQRLTPILIDVVAKNRSATQPIQKPRLTLRITNAAGDDITPLEATTNVASEASSLPTKASPDSSGATSPSAPPELIGPGETFIERLIWYQNARDQKKFVPAGIYTLALITTTSNGPSEVVFSRGITIDNSLQWTLRTGTSSFPPDSVTTMAIPQFPLKQAVPLTLQVTNTSKRTLRPFFEKDFSIYDETRNQTIVLNRVHHTAAEFISPIAPGDTQSFFDKWDQTGSIVPQAQPLYGSDGTIIGMGDPARDEPFTPKPGLYRISFLRWGEVIASQWIEITDNPVALSSDG